MIEYSGSCHRMLSRVWPHRALYIMGVQSSISGQRVRVQVQDWKCPNRLQLKPHLNTSTDMFLKQDYVTVRYMMYRGIWVFLIHTDVAMTRHEGSTRTYCFKTCPWQFWDWVWYLHWKIFNFLTKHVHRNFNWPFFFSFTFFEESEHAYCVVHCRFSWLQSFAIMKQYVIMVCEISATLYLSW